MECLFDRRYHLRVTSAKYFHGIDIVRLITLDTFSDHSMSPFSYFLFNFI